ncbi:DUF805 domain-containing protein [Clostridium sediminicola]|uniref:DUF805 domain-containing protein n=1 Tax=Clostridium sediminicola TaxID=3114879 RepID=UPI0031F1CA26
MSWYIAVLKKYVQFDGRARRKEFWMFVLFNFIFSIIASIIDYALGGGNTVGIVYGLAVFFPSLSVGIRRLHDTGKSGWFTLVTLIPIIGWIWYLILVAAEGNNGPNEYGEDPKATEAI